MTDNNLVDEIRKNPYQFICKYAEDLFPLTGGECFELLALMPVSMFVKDITYMSKKVRSNMNVMLLTISGGAKSSLAGLLAKFAFNPIEVKSITPAELIDRCYREEEFTLIVEDYARMSADEDINKVIEGVTGEEKLIDRHTKTLDLRKNINAVALLCGVPSDLSENLTSGTIFRTLPLVIVHDDGEHSDIGKHISKYVGVSGDYDSREAVIKEYYDLLYRIQKGDRTAKESGWLPVSGFIMSDKIRNTIHEEWDKKTKFYRKNAPYNFFRELWDGYRILFAHAFLNYFNREKKDNKIVVTEEDLEVALRLSKKTMDTKYQLLLSEKFVRGIRNLNHLKVFMDNKKIPTKFKYIVESRLKALK